MHTASLSYVFVAIAGTPGAMARFGPNVLLQRSAVDLVPDQCRLLVAVEFCGSCTYRLRVYQAACIYKRRARHWAPVS